MDFKEIEEKILKFWQDSQIFEKSLKRREKSPSFVFYEGPPSANARPGIHHVLTRVYKDVICRYKTMRGFYVGRRAGWDTHGLPIEIEAEKELGIKNKKEIEKYGIEKFNKKCRELVFKYKKDWEDLTRKIGFWLDLKNPYITFKNNYIETLWRIIKEIYKKGLLYEDYKVVPYCPRCGTALSSHEVAQGYKKVTDPSIYVKFKIQNSHLRPTYVNASAGKQGFGGQAKFKIPEYLLVWTTTPWTLSANVAVAVNPQLTYTKFKINGEYYWSYSTPQFNNPKEIEIVERMSGKKLVGLEYEPLYKLQISAFAEAMADRQNEKGKIKIQNSKLTKFKNLYKVVAGDFVSTEEGTGLVHIAPAFGIEDMMLAKKENLPTVMTVNEEGRFIKISNIKYQISNIFKKLEGMFVKDADPLIIEELKKRNLLYFEDPRGTLHDYPFCWRCQSPLLYYAKTSWFINMQKVKEDLIKNNQKINWVPSHIKEGRFGEWLVEIKDWAFSRARYWATPLPVWKCEKCGEIEVIGSLEELASKNPQKNNYFILRHGETDKNKNGTHSCWPEKIKFNLNQNGRKQILALVKRLKSAKIDFIFSSDLVRTKDTAGIIAKELGIKKIYFDKKIREYNVGIFNGASIEDLEKYFSSEIDKFTKAPPGGETWSELKKRMFDFISGLEEKYKKKNILIISHGDPLWILEGAVKGLDNEDMLDEKILPYIKTGELKQIIFNNLSYDQDANLDLHRPYIDKITFNCNKCKKEMKRVSEVVDVWFDAGAMPFAQNPRFWAQSQKSATVPPNHPVKETDYIAKVKSQKLQFPADFIAEGVDQTRGWFYTLLAVSTLLNKGTAYKNVISLGHVLDKYGEKMSKSKGNVVDPWEVIERYGVDATRWYFYTTNTAGEPKKFDLKDIEERLRKFVMTFYNSYFFYKTYVVKNKKLKIKNKNPKSKIKNVLDKWILSRLNEVIHNVTFNLDKYDVTLAARSIDGFLDDLSNWYIRRSRLRFQQPESEEKKEAVQNVLKHVLVNLAIISSPFAPFVSEEIYKELTGRESVHLADFPKFNKKLINKNLNENMEAVRKIVAFGLQARAKVGIKVRQPIASLKIKNKIENIKNNAELLNLIKDELNVKKIELVKELKPENNLVIVEFEELSIGLDITITPKLKEEGQVREFIRRVQDMRRDAGYVPRDEMRLFYHTASDFGNVLLRWKKEVMKKSGITKMELTQNYNKVFDVEKDFDLDGNKIWVAIKKF